MVVVIPLLIVYNMWHVRKARPSAKLIEQIPGLQVEGIFLNHECKKSLNNGNIISYFLPCEFRQYIGCSWTLQDPYAINWPLPVYAWHQNLQAI